MSGFFLPDPGVQASCWLPQMRCIPSTVIQSTVDFQGWLGDERQADFRHCRGQRGAGSRDAPKTLSGCANILPQKWSCEREYCEKRQKAGSILASERKMDTPRGRLLSANGRFCGVRKAHAARGLRS